MADAGVHVVAARRGLMGASLAGNYWPQIEHDRDTRAGPSSATASARTAWGKTLKPQLGRLGSVLRRSA